jgi:putative transposase
MPIPDIQLLTHTLRLPDEQQVAVLRWLAFARQSVNTVLTTLWPRLDEFAEGEHQAWKQLVALLPPPHRNGSRQWRCEAETAGRILRAQAARKGAFDLMRPLLTEGLIRPATEGYPAKKNRRVLLQRIIDLRTQVGDDGHNLGLLLNVMEQVCNFYLKHGRFPADYFELQPVPLLKVGLLAFAADDGPVKGQTYRLAFEAGQVQFRFRAPDANGQWQWQPPGQARQSAAERPPRPTVVISLPEATQALLEKGVPAAPQLRELVQVDGASVAVLDLVFEVPAPPLPNLPDCQRVLSFDWGVRTLLTVAVMDVAGTQVSRPLFFDTGGFDGKQARLRGQIDQLKAKRDRLPENHPERARLQHEIDLCWNAYTHRNKALAHLAANFLLIVSGLYGCRVLAGEWLATLKSVGQGRDVNGRWRNWRNNTQLRSAITTVLEYKCKLSGKRLRLESPRGTSHTCPRCGQPADTFKSPEHTRPDNWGAWLKCARCEWSGSRDYAAALNIGRLAVAYLAQAHAAPSKKSKRGFRVSDAELKPVSYSGAGAALPFPPPNVTLICPRVNRPARSPKGTIFSVRGWPDAVMIHPLRSLGLRC